MKNDEVKMFLPLPRLLERLGKLFSKIHFFVRKIEKIKYRRRHPEDLETWHMTQGTKLKSQDFGDSAKKNQKNNLTRFGFRGFYTIYKRGNEN